MHNVVLYEMLFNIFIHTRVYYIIIKAFFFFIFHIVYNGETDKHYRSQKSATSPKNTMTKVNAVVRDLCEK